MKGYCGLIFLTILTFAIPSLQSRQMLIPYDDSEAVDGSSDDTGNGVFYDTGNGVYYDTGNGASNQAGSGASNQAGSGINPQPSLPYPTDDPTNIKCGRKGLLVRIVGGTKAPLGAWPWQIGIKSCANSKCKIFCGGAIVAKKWVVTAAHCIYNLYKPHELFIEAGTVNQVNVSSHKQAFRGKEIHIHQGYKYRTYDQDIAVIKLDNEVVYNDFVRPLCLNDRKLKDDERCVVTGFGKTSKHRIRTSAYLRQATVPIVSRKTCAKAYTKRTMTKNMICAGFAHGGIDSCGGDSGGPLSCYDIKEQRYFLGGIVSWGVGCGKANNYGVYTNVAPLVPWINKIIGDT